MTTLNLTVTADADDWQIPHWETAWHFLSAGEDYLGGAWTGEWDTEYYWAGARFAIGSALTGTTINSAYLSLYGFDTWGWDSDTHGLRLFVTDSGDAAQVTTENARPSYSGGSTSLYPSTFSNGIRWPASGGLTWNESGYNQSVDIDTLIQYLVDTYTMGSTAHIVVWVTTDLDRNVGTNDGYEVGFRDRYYGAGTTPKLDIDYTVVAERQPFPPAAYNELMVY